MSCRVPLFGLVLLLCAMATFVLAHRDTLPQAAAIGAAIDIDWTGTIERIFVGGEGLEIRSLGAPDGIFHAYMPDRIVSPYLDGTVRIRGRWQGWTCDYGDRCVPEVDIEKIERAR